VAPKQLLQHKAPLQLQLQPQGKPQPPAAQHQQPSAGRRSHRTLPKDQTQLLSLQHDHRHRERERQRQREKPGAVVQKLTANSGSTAAAAVAASAPSRPANSQRSAVKPCLPPLSSTFNHLYIPCLSVCISVSRFHSIGWLFTLILSLFYLRFLQRRMRSNEVKKCIYLLAFGREVIFIEKLQDKVC